MKATGLHPGLERRLKALETRIGKLKSEMARAKGVDKLDELGDVEVLEQRYKELEARLAALNREGPGFRQDLKAEAEKMADDLAANFEDFALRQVSGELSARRPKRPGKT
jgi:predicted  nucleic acid-binding Zn-ribbon protein